MCSYDTQCNAALEPFHNYAYAVTYNRDLCYCICAVLFFFLFVHYVV